MLLTKVGIFIVLAFPLLGTTSVYTSTFNQGASSITVPFQPKALMVRASINTAVGQANNLTYVLGYCIPNGTQVSMFNSWDNGGTTATARRALINDSCALIWSSAGTVLADLTVGVCTSSSCPLTWRTNDGTARIFDYTAWGGATVSAAAGFGGTGGSMTPTITTGFQPLMVFLASSTTTTIAHGGALPVNMDFTFGAQPGATSSGSGVSFAGANTSTTTGTVQCNANSSCWLASAGSSVFIGANITSTNSTSFTLQLTGSNYSSNLGYLAIGDSGTTNWTVGNSTALTTVGTQNLTVGGTPGWAMLYSLGTTSADGIVLGTSVTFGHGVVTNATKQSRFFTAKTAANPQVAISEYKTDHVLRLLDVTGATANASVDIATFTSTNLALHWDVVSATAYKFGYVTCDCVVASLASSVIHHGVKAQ